MAVSLTASPAVPSPSASAATAAKVAYLTHKIHVLELFLLGGYCVMFVLCVLLIVYMRYNRNVALRGDASAARKIILPAFEPLLWILGGATGIYTAFFATALAADLYTSEISKVSSEFFYSGRQFVFVSVIVFLFQKSVSIPALRRTLFVSFLLSTYTIPIVWYVVNYSSGSDFYLILMVVRGLLLLLYAYVLLRPPARASKRTLREFCAYTFIYYGLLFSYIEMFRRKKPDLAFSLTYANIVWASMCPLVIWRLLKADTEHWRGLGQRAVALQGLFRQRRSALDERVSSQGFHLLIEMHRRYIIDFAYLDIKHQIGSGASASVFHGVLHGKTRVAVKVYSPAEFDEQTVAAFSHEAALCGALNHPNIVRFYGMCVCPPTICLVSELCGGSLDDVVALAHRQRDRHPGRQQFLLNIGYMIDAARAVAYLHSFSPPFVHRDIKPSNFLVDFNGTVKLTDFGESRSLPRANNAGRELHPYMVLASGAHVNQHGRYSGNANNLQFASSSGPSSSAMTVRGTVDYMAPEVINGRAGVAAYGEAADIYSLAITMWDVLYPGRDKYPTLRNNHLQIFESVIEGKRPTLDDSVHPSLREVIKSAWQSDPRLRPSAQNIVHILENIQEEIQAVFAAQLLDAMDTSSTTEGDVPRPRRNRTSSSLAECSFSGEEAVAHMIANGFVASACEGVRMGNALMDSGMMHHLHHTHGFGDDVEFYYFDDDNVNLCQPEAPVPRLNGTPLGMEEDEEKSNDSSTSRRSRTSDGATSRVNSRRPSKMIRRPLKEQHGLCACRKLGQNLGRSRSRSAKRAKQTHKVTTRIGTIMEEMTSTGLTRSLLAEEERESGVLHAKSDHVAINMPGPAAA